MKSYSSFMAVRFVLNFFLLTSLFLFGSTSYADDCMNDFSGSEEFQGSSLYFDGIEFPLLNEYVVGVPDNDLLIIISYKCLDIQQSIVIMDRESCLLCGLNMEKVESLGFSVIEYGEINERSYRFLNNNGQTVLMIWNSEKALEIKDQNYEYLEYVLSLFLDG